MRTQKVKIQKFIDMEAEGKPIPIECNLLELEAKLLELHKKATKKKDGKIIQNKTKHKKLGMGLDMWTSDNHSDIAYNTFWPVKLEKPKHTNGSGV